jgi:hypothetical protein
MVVNDEGRADGGYSDRPEQGGPGDAFGVPPVVWGCPVDSTPPVAAAVVVGEGGTAQVRHDLKLA